MLRRAQLRAGEALRAAGAPLVVVTISDAQRAFVQSLGHGDAVRGAVSIGETHLRAGADFAWPDCLPPPVPLPAAVWLLGSALAGLGLFGKRRKV